MPVRPLPMTAVADVTLVASPSSNLERWSGSGTLLEVGLHLRPGSIIMLQDLLVLVRFHRARVVKVSHRPSELLHIAIDVGLEFFDGRKHPRNDLERQEKRPLYHSHYQNFPRQVGDCQK